MASKHVLRGTGSGIFLSAAALAAFVYLQPDSLENANQASQHNSGEPGNGTNGENSHELTDDLSVITEENEHLKQEVEQLERVIQELEASEDDAEDTGSREVVYQSILTVEEGMTSQEISALLEELNIIADPADFEQALANLNAEQQIQIGTYTVTSDMAAEEVADLVTP